MAPVVVASGQFKSFILLICFSTPSVLFMLPCAYTSSSDFLLASPLNLIPRKSTSIGAPMLRDHEDNLRAVDARLAVDIEPPLGFLASGVSRPGYYFAPRMTGRKSALVGVRGFKFRLCRRAGSVRNGAQRGPSMISMCTT